MGFSTFELNKSCCVVVRMVGLTVTLVGLGHPTPPTVEPREVDEHVLVVRPGTPSSY